MYIQKTRSTINHTMCVVFTHTSARKCILRKYVYTFYMYDCVSKIVLYNLFLCMFQVSATYTHIGFGVRKYNYCYTSANKLEGSAEGCYKLCIYIIRCHISFQCTLNFVPVV